ncbi:type I secretion C-terminal target domain-containing protein, partial [Paracandidimonas soli]
TLDGRAAHDDAAATGASDQKQDDFAVRATDSDDDVSPEATLSISINDDGPAANDFIGVGEVTEDSAAANSVGGNLRTDGGNTFGADDAAAANALTYTNVQATLNGNPVDLADYGTLSVDTATGEWSFVLDNTKPKTQALGAGETVNVSFDYTLTDKDGDTDGGKVNFAINGQNDEPVLEAHTKEILEDNIATGNVLVGAADAEDDDLSVTQFTVNGTPYAAGTTAIIAGIGEFTISSNGDYIFTPAQDWNGAVPQVTYEVSDGTDTSSSTLDIDVLPVNDAPTSEDASGNVTEGLTYVFGASDFAFEDAVEGDAMQSVIIDSLPSGGTLLLDGVAVTPNTSISAADLAAGKLTFVADANPGENAEFSFNFRVQDAGGIDNGGVDTSGQHTFTLTVDQFISGNNLNNNNIKGGAGDDVLLGDQGGLRTNVVSGASYNIALVLDVSGSMNDKWGPGAPTWPWQADNRPTRLDTAKASLKALLSNQLLTHDGDINVTLITFGGSSSTNQISIEGLNASNIDSILDKITSLTASGSTPYGSGFNSAKSWFDSMGNNSDYDDYQNLTFFLTDGAPTDNANNRDNAFDALSNVSMVHGIGIGSGISQSTLNRYDNTDVQSVVIDTGRSENHANFDNNSGVNNVDNWGHTGSGSVTKNDNAMRIADNNSAANQSSTVTMAEAHKMVVADGLGAFFRFSASTGSWSNNNDVFTWRLLKWDADANNGQGDWVVAQSGNNTGTVTTSHHGPGEYLLQFDVNNQSDNNAHVTIDNIRIHKTISTGQSQVVTDPSQLEAVLVGGTEFDEPAPVGDDTIFGGDGKDIIFGDAINTDSLPWGVDGNPSKPADYSQTGLDALKDFLALKLGHAATDADLYEYITENHELFNVVGDTHGGTDTLHGGKGDDILYGQGGNDTLIGGEGDDILYGGEGDDIFKWEEGDAGVDAVAVDTIMDFGVGNDSLDLAELLVGENSGNLDQFLSLEQIGADTVIKVSTDGTLGQGHNQEIILKGVDLSDLTGGATTQADMIQNLIQQGKLNVDQ